MSPTKIGGTERASAQPQASLAGPWWRIFRSGLHHRSVVSLAIALASGGHGTRQTGGSSYGLECGEWSGTAHGSSVIPCGYVPNNLDATAERSLTDELISQTLAVLSCGHRLFAGGVAVGRIGHAPEQIDVHADHISRTTSAVGFPVGPTAARSEYLAQGLRRCSASDRTLARVVASARADHAYARTATRTILQSAEADAVPATDTLLGRRELAARMLARVRTQHRHIVRARSRARWLALRLLRQRYLWERTIAQRRTQNDPAPTGLSGRSAVLAAIRKALDFKGIHDPSARARWERGMDLVACRESNYNPHAVNRWDSNAARGTPSTGVWQFIAPTFARYHQAGTSPNIHDLVAQACAFINYAQAQYGVAADASNLADRIQQADPRRSPRGY